MVQSIKTLAATTVTPATAQAVPVGNKIRKKGVTYSKVANGWLSARTNKVITDAEFARL